MYLGLPNHFLDYLVKTNLVMHASYWNPLQRSQVFMSLNSTIRNIKETAWLNLRPDQKLLREWNDTG